MLRWHQGEDYSIKLEWQNCLPALVILIFQKQRPLIIELELNRKEELILFREGGSE